MVNQKILMKKILPKEILIIAIATFLFFISASAFAQTKTFRRVEMQGDLLIFRKGEWIELYCGGKTQDEIYQSINKTTLLNAKTTF